jgi:dipeptidyl aminopeptidase/acylaminoacyl peptidase
MACLTADRPEFEELSPGNEGYSSGVNAAVDWYGPTDFLVMDSQLAAAGLGPGRHSAADSPESRLLGACVAESPLLVQTANPVNYVRKGMPPILIQHGSADAVVPCRQSELLAAEIERVAGPGVCEFEILRGAGHADAAFERPDNMEKVFSFLNRRLAKRGSAEDGHA